MIIVTGGAGFIGSCIVERLNAEGRGDIIIVDHIEPGSEKQKNIQNKKYARYFDKKDFLDIILKDQIEGEIEHIIHMGACSSTTLQDAQYYQENNFWVLQFLFLWQYPCHIPF